MSTVRQADSIIALDLGRSYGRRRAYAELYQKQLLEEGTGGA